MSFHYLSTSAPKRNPHLRPVSPAVPLHQIDPFATVEFIKNSNIEEIVTKILIEDKRYNANFYLKNSFATYWLQTYLEAPYMKVLHQLKFKSSLSESIVWFLAHNPELSRKEQMIISRLRTRYTRATHRHVIEKTDTPNCPFCDIRLTTDHILWQCDETRNKRDECRIRCTVWKEGREGSKKLIDYVRKIGFYHGILRTKRSKKIKKKKRFCK
jgi:hypothetical protein